MKSVINVYKINTAEDVNLVRQAISANEGVIACQINKENGEVDIVYDSFFLTIEDIIESIEELGYTVI